MNFKHGFNHKDQGAYLMVGKEGNKLVYGFKKADIEYPLRHGTLLITLWMVNQYTQTLQTYRHPTM
jgi:hypothetical protein